MHRKLTTKFKHLSRVNKGIVVTAIVCLFILAFLLVTRIAQPTRSVAAYCSAYRQGVTKLGNDMGNIHTYSTSLFPVASSGNPGDFIPVLNKLDKVAPLNIEPQVKAMRDTFLIMRNNPTQTLSAAINGTSAQDVVTQWTQQHCGL